MNRRIINGLLAASCLSLSACQYIGWNDDPAMTAFVHGDYIQAFHRLEHRARLGDTAAQYAVGYMSYYGLGTPENRDLAINWFEVSAKYGYQPAQQALRILTHDTYKASVNIAPQPAQQTASIVKTVDWIREKNPENYTVEVRQPTMAAELQQKNYPLVSYRYMENDKVHQAWIYGDFKTQEQAKMIQDALLQEQVRSKQSEYYLQAGLTQWSQPQIKNQCVNTEVAMEQPSYSVVVGPFATLEDAHTFRQTLPVETAVQSYAKMMPVKVALKSMRDIQVSMLP